MKEEMRFFTQKNKDGVISARFIYSGKSEITDLWICFRLLSKCSAVSGCKIKHQVGGYTELVPSPTKSLSKDDEWEFSFKYELDRHSPANVSWGPMGTYLKLKNGQAVEVLNETLKFPKITSQTGKQLSMEEPKLRLIPHPFLWEKKSLNCDLSSGINFSGDFSEKVGKAIKSFKSLIERWGLQEVLSFGGVQIVFENIEDKFEEERICTGNKT